MTQYGSHPSRRRIEDLGDPVWFLDAVGRDVRYALRGMLRTPGFTAVALATLTLAIGANTAIFSVVNQLLVRPLPYRDADRLVVIDAMRDYEGTPRPVRASFQLDSVQRWQASLHAFEDVAFYEDQVFEMSTPQGSDIRNGAIVSSSFFSALGGPIVAGRPIDASNALTPSIVISQRLWQRLFNGSPDAIGAHLILNSNDYTVIGIAGPEWDLPSSKADVWQPAEFAHVLDPQCCDVQLLARLKPGVTVVQARADVRHTAQALAAVDARGFARLHPSVTTLRDKQLGEGRTALLLLWAAVGVVLIVACANVLNLLVARNLARTREITIRRALGASRGRLVLQGLTESGLLGAGGVTGGVLIARAVVALMARLDPETFPRLHDVSIDGVVLAFAVALGIVTTLSTGILPAVHTANAPALRTSTNAPTRRHRHLQRLLCVAQLGAAALLLISATLLGRSLVDLLGTDLGVVSDHVLTASINVAFGRKHTAEEVAVTMQRVVDRVQQVPGVLAAGTGTSLPPDASRLMMSLKRKSDNVDYIASAVSCTPGYFQALAIRLLKGRFFTAADDARHPPVIIVSATTARRLFGGIDPIGQTFTVPKFRYRLTTAPDATVVGVVADVKYSGMDAAPGDQVYWSLQQAPWLSTFLTVRTVGDVNVASTLREIVASVDPTVAVADIKPLESIIATATAPARFRTVLIGAFALIGLAIAAVGLYGIIAYSVSQRTAELGVRMALGAAKGDVLRLVLVEAISIAVAGLAVGLPAAYATSRTFAALLFGVAPTDPLTYALSAGGLLVLALVASYAPARAAAHVDPIVALRTE
jgi:putative ABC transport system permease protein